MPDPLASSLTHPVLKEESRGRRERAKGES